VRAALALVVLAVILAAPAGAAVRVTAKLTTSSAAPVVDQPWRYTVTVRSSAGMPLAAKVKLQLLLGRTVVGCWKGGEIVQCFNPAAGQWISFRGKRSGVLRFPAQSLGVGLTFQATVMAEPLTFKLRAPVTVRAG
jgi:hypothetical protein